MTRKELFKKWNAHEEHGYDISETDYVTDDEGRSPDIFWIYSGRNRGKSFTICAECLADAYYDDRQLLYLRRHDATAYEVEDYFGDKSEFIKDMTDGRSDSVSYYRGSLYLSHTSTDLKTAGKRILDQEIGKFHAVSRHSSVKSLQYPKIFNYIYEEVLTDEAYISNEPDKIIEIWSTFTRHKKDARMFLISNLVSIVNPYSKAWGLNLSKLKPDDTGLTKLYLNRIGKDGKEEYLLIAAHYLKDARELTKEDLKDKKKNRIKSTSNRWDEARLYPHIDLKYIKLHDFKCIYTALFEWDDLIFQADIMRVPENVLTCFLEEKEDEDLSSKNIHIMYIRRKTTPPKLNPRIYTNNPDRMGQMITKGFKNVCKVDEIITDLTMRGWIIGTDNLCMNDFMRIYQNLRLMAR